MSIRIHYEIGHIIKNNGEADNFGVNDTESVFRADTLSECLEEFAKQGYTTEDYFIDVWEQDGESNPPYPIADIKLDDATLADSRAKFAKQTYSVQLKLYIDAKDKEGAITEFYIKANECAFTRADLVVIEQ